MSNITEEGLNEIRDLMESDQATDVSITANFFGTSGEYFQVNQTMTRFNIPCHSRRPDHKFIFFFSYFRIYWIAMKEHSDAWNNNNRNQSFMLCSFIGLFKPQEQVL